jgi:biopolymer transport protein ExbD
LSVVGLFVFIWAMLLAQELGFSGFVDYGTAVSVPRNMDHVRIGRLAFKRSMTLSLPKEGEVYWESHKTSKEVLPDKIGQSAVGRPEANRIVYVEAASDAKQLEIVDLLRLVRQAGMDRSRLIVRQRDVSADRPGRSGWFEVRLEPESNAAPDVSELKPDPFKLVAGIQASGKLSLNATNFGTIEDPSFLAWRLSRIFAERAESGLAERTVTVKADHEIEYGDVAKLVDCLAGAGADPIVMQLDAPLTIPKKPVMRR